MPRRPCFGYRPGPKEGPYPTGSAQGRAGGPTGERRIAKYRTGGRALVSPKHPRSRGWEQRAGFTLLELLFSVGIIALLLSILLPSLRSVRDQAKCLICMDHLRTASFQFRMFADPYGHKDRGDSEGLGSRFEAPDFLDSLYETDEYWTNLGEPRIDFKPAQEPVLCPSGPRRLSKVLGQPCNQGGIEPQQNISYAMNRRLFEAPLLGRLTRVYIPERILDSPNVPLIFDADGEWSTQLRGGVVDALFAAPPMDDERSPYASGEYWHRSLRHRRKMNIGFVGGHVASTGTPLADSTWDWGYHPPVDR